MKTQLAYLIILLVLTSTASGKYSGGTGEPNDPYLIETPNDLNSIGLDPCDWDKHFKMVADINLAGFTGTAYNIIGTRWDKDFTGVFDGNGHTISNFSWESEVYERAIGLFGFVGENAVIIDLHVENVDINAPNCNRVGALVGETQGSPLIISCSSSGMVTGDFYIGGIAGDLWGQAIRCYSSCTVSGGGAGVITGHVDGALSDSFAAGMVFGTEQAGGLAGRNYGTIVNCYSFGVVNSSGYLSGGLVGINGGTIFNSYSQADVQGTDDVGGLAGKNHPQGIIENCYSTGTVDGAADVGGFLGYNSGGTVTSCFWDMEASDCNVSDGGIGLTTVQMQQQSTFTNSGWDFVGETANGYEDIWRMCVDGVNYPKLSWEFSGYGDLVCPDGVDFIDYSILANEWQLERLEQDYNSDGRVNFKDWAIFANNWEGSYTELPPFVACWLARSARIADIAPTGGDDFVDWQDLATLAMHWLEGTE